MTTTFGPTVPFGEKREPLTSRYWLWVFDRLAASKPAGKSSSITLDLSTVPWIGHLPLLALCLLTQKIQSVDHYEEARVLMPNSDGVRAFLERWHFYSFLRSKGFTPIGDPEILLSESFTKSCVLPIRAFSRSDQAREIADDLQDTGTQIYRLLKTAAFLDDEGIRGLADLIVHELCKNVIEHSAASGDAFVFGRVSKPDDKVRSVYEENAASWETNFLQAIHGEGMTELVLGDAGVGIVPSLREEAGRYGKTTPQEILEWAFAPFSTSKADSGQHTRGLWAVKNKVRELRGVLYVRTYDGNGGGVSAWWDFLNDPDCDPTPGKDTTPFPGTQFQILLPHLTEERPRTFISSDRAAAAAANRQLRAVGFQIPPEPPPKSERLGLSEAIRNLRPDEVLFIDMSRMDQDAWDRAHVDAVGRAITLHDLSEDVSLALGADFRRIWLLNPKDKTLDRLRSSSWVSNLWREHAILQPIVKLAADPATPPAVSFVVSDERSRSKEEGDSETARLELYRLVSDAFENVLTRASIGTLNAQERAWLTTHLAMNSSSVEVRADVEGRIVPAFDVETLANATVEALLPLTLRDKIDTAFAEQNAVAQRVWYQLPSGQYSENYVDPRILTDLDPQTLNAMEKWIERRVSESRAEYAISYTNAARPLLARAARGNPAIRHLVPLKHYVPAEYEQLEKTLPDGARVVILVSITGSGATIETILGYLATRKVSATVVSVINTTAAQRKPTMPQLAALEREGRFKYLLAKPIELFPEIPDDQKKRPIAAIDPETFLPVVPVRSFVNLLSDGEFWSIAGEAQGLSVEPVTYKGRDYDTVFQMRNFFRSGPVGTPNARAMNVVFDHLETCFEGRYGPDIICVNRETNDALKKTGADARTRDRFPNATNIAEGTPEFAKATKKLEGKHVVIFSAAAYSGNAITRLLKRFETAKRIHICVFLTRIPEPMIASFTRQPKVTFNSFFRLFSASSESSMGSSRVIRLQNLADYRPSCVSHRLLLFVEEEQREAEHHRAAQDPDTLESMITPLPKPAADLFQPGETYDFLSETGKSDLARLVRRCREEDAEWLYAVLEEAASRSEHLDRGFESDAQTRVTHLEEVSALYKAASNAAVKTKVLQALLLDRWHGREELTPRGIPGFGHALLSDLKAAHAPVELRATCVRALSKVDRKQLIDELEDIIEVVRTDRQTELTLAVELTKILDDEKRWDHLRAAFERILNRGARPRMPETATEVAIRCLLDDVGLYQKDNGRIDFLPWERIYAVLRSEPPDDARTVRSLIRSIRSLLGPRARILYYRREESATRFVYLDAWPRKEATAVRPVRERNVVAASLLEARRDFFSPNISEPGPGFDLYYSKLKTDVDRADLKDNALFLHKIGTNGILRIFYDVSEGHRMPPEALETLQNAMVDVTNLPRRADSQLTRIGMFQYLQTVEKFQVQPRPEGVDPLREFLQHVFALLGADVGSIMVLTDERQWKRDHVLGRRDEGETVEFPNDDRHRVTVEAARRRTHLRFPNDTERQREGFTYGGLVPWAPAWLAIPMLQPDGGCRIVLNLWHHIAGWFDPQQYPDELIRSLSTLGGAIVQIKAEHQKARDTQRHEFNRIEIDHLAVRLRNLTLIAQGEAEMARAHPMTASLDDVARRVAEIHDKVEALLRIAQEDDLPVAPTDLAEIVTNSVVSARTLYGDDKFELPALRGTKVAAPVEDPRMLSRTMAELLKNAKMHLRALAKVHVGLEYSDADVAISIEVRSPESTDSATTPQIFDSPDDLGLKLARVAVRRHGGSITELVRQGDNAMVRLNIPIRRETHT